MANSTDLGSLTRAFGPSRASASYGFGAARLATTLLTITTLSGWRRAGRYRLILGPGRRLPEFANGPGGNPGRSV